MADIRIDDRAGGEWIAEQLHGCYKEGVDHCLVHYRSGEPWGGFLVEPFVGQSVCIHMAGGSPGWCSRELMFMLFHYVFRQLRCHKVFAPVEASNTVALAQDLRAGWGLETVLRDAAGLGRHVMVLSMTAEGCRWLGASPRRAFMSDMAKRLRDG